MKLLGVIGVIIILIIIFAVFTFNRGSQESTYETTKATSETIKTSPQPTPSVNYQTIDNFIEYKVPSNWKKEVSDPVEEVRVVKLMSPNYRYNSVEGKDDGISIWMIRQKFKANTSLKEKLIADGNPYVDKKDFKVTPVTIGGKEGYYFPSANDGIGSDPNFSHIAVLKDGYQYNFLFYGANGEGQRASVDSFISSIKFK